MISTKGYDGIGIGIFDGFCAIDLDHCIVNGTLTSAASDIINTMESYTEISPSGDGIHILFRVDGYHFDTGKFYIMNHKQGMVDVKPQLMNGCL